MILVAPPLGATADDPARTAIDAIIEIFTWLGFAAAAVLTVAALIAWAADGSWLPAEAIVDREGDEVVVRWFDNEHRARRAALSPADAAAVGAADAAAIWYRLGPHDRARLTQRPAGLRALALSAAGAAALGVLCLVTGVVLLLAA